MLDIDGQHVKCMRLPKTLYPQPRFTKAEVIEYYVRVAPFLLPHLRGRAVTLERYPDGVTGEAYWEKDVPSFTPEWVETFPVPRHAGGPDINYILIQNTATLAWAANAAALELHPFLHRVPEIASPTEIVFDLDPGTGADIRQCIEVAFLLRRVIEQPGLKLFPKVSGGPIRWRDRDGVDIGTYEVVEGNYWTGNLHISLKGKKLKGEWSLRRDRAEGERAWVLERVGEGMKLVSAKKEQAGFSLAKQWCQCFSRTGFER